MYYWLYSFPCTYTKTQHLYPVSLFAGSFQSFDSRQASDILKKILEGVEYIHSCGIMHRDLKVGLYKLTLDFHVL